MNQTSVSPDSAQEPGSVVQPVLSVRNATKRFGGATALNGVDFDLRPGEIHGLVGENGAGKSTLVKILSGVQRPDSGEVLLNGEPIRFRSPADAKAHGIGMIFQELTLMPALTVAENVFLGRQPTTRFGIVDWRRIKREAGEQLAEFDIHIDVTERIGQLTLGNQQLVEIARVINSGADVIILDEPTSALSPPEAERLFELLRSLKASGKSLIFISHFLEDVLAISDRVTVLKNSNLVGTYQASELTKHRLVQLMIGRDDSTLAESYESGVALPAPIDSRAVLSVSDLASEGEFQNITFDVHEGEILGLFGYLGAGMTEIARALFGTLKTQNGHVTLDDQPYKPKTPTQAKRSGLAYLSENRRATLFPKHEIYKNVTLAHLEHLVKPVFRHPSEIAVVGPLIERTGVRPKNAELPAGHLSGGNQQKVVLAKWLTQQPKVLILNEPTRGMDVGAKREVLDLVRELKDEGVAILLLSTEPETVLTESDRILVLSKGEITKEFVNETVTKEDLLLYA
ncbi:MAG: sugar ABC transporter ATP-binding protein [Thermomicrobiales bacterium]|nr:sugar ABC transporter ATP-binding protein [Thermomicrobiales bacterium]